MNEILFLLGAILLLCLLPVALYLLYLAQINHRRQPTVISGAVDFGLLLFGLSGFILLGGLILVWLLDSNLRAQVFRGGFARLAELWRNEAIFWTLIVFAYLCFFAGSILFFFRGRERRTIIYNGIPNVVENCLIQVLTSNNFPWRKSVLGLEIGSFPDETSPDPEKYVFYEPTLIEIESFATLQNVNLIWTDEAGPVRRTIERELQSRLNQTESPPNPATSWLMTISVSLVVVLFMWICYLFWVLIIR